MSSAGGFFVAGVLADSHSLALALALPKASVRVTPLRYSSSEPQERITAFLERRQLGDDSNLDQQKWRSTHGDHNRQATKKNRGRNSNVASGKKRKASGKQRCNAGNYFQNSRSSLIVTVPRSSSTPCIPLLEMSTSMVEANSTTWAGPTGSGWRSMDSNVLKKFGKA